MTLAEDVAAQHARLWGDAPTERVALKVAEEAGEIAGAIVKLSEGRRSVADVVHELGDLAYALEALAARFGTSLAVVEAEALGRNAERANTAARTIG